MFQFGSQDCVPCSLLLLCEDGVYRSTKIMHSGNFSSGLKRYCVCTGVSGALPGNSLILAVGVPCVSP